MCNPATIVMFSIGIPAPVPLMVWKQDQSYACPVATSLTA